MRTYTGNYHGDPTKQAEEAAVSNEQGTDYRLMEIITGKCHITHNILINDE